MEVAARGHAAFPRAAAQRPPAAMRLAVAPVGCKAGGGSATLVSTASTVSPMSSGPSREGSAPDLAPLAAAAVVVAPSVSVAVAAGAADVARRLPPEKLLSAADFDLQDCMSRGRYASVYRGALTSAGARVVVKTAVGLGPGASRLDSVATPPEGVTDLLLEIGVLARLDHPRIVNFVGACLEADRIALVTEYEAGGNLHQAIHVQRRELARSERFALSRELFEAVAYLHSRRPPIAHMDLKSLNLVLDGEGRHLKVCDFGLARAVANEELEELRVKCQGGSPRYMAPECHDEALGPATERADIWSAGCVLIEIFAAVAPYVECSNVQQILNAMLVHRRGPTVPSGIEAAVRGAMHCALAFEASSRLPAQLILTQLVTVEGRPAIDSRLGQAWGLPCWHEVAADA